MSKDKNSKDQKKTLSDKLKSKDKVVSAYKAEQKTEDISFPTVKTPLGKKK